MSDQLGHLKLVKDHSLSRLSLVGSNCAIGALPSGTSFHPPPAMPQQLTTGGRAVG